MLLIRLLLFLLILTWKVGDVADPTAPSQAERATHPLSSASPGEELAVPDELPYACRCPLQLSHPHQPIRTLHFTF